MKLFIPLVLFCSLLMGQKYSPKCNETQKLIKHSEFILQYNSQHKQADWVHHFITKSRIKGNTKRKNNFKPDKSVNEGQVTLEDYQKSGYDRGHLAPAGDFKFLQSAVDESFLLSNMSPQKPELNRKTWKDLESLVRNWTANYDTIYVTTGPIFNKKLGSIGKNKITVPGGYFKVILAVKEGEYRSAAFVLPNEDVTKRPLDYIISVDEAEEISGIDFFPELPDTVENKIESKVNKENWPVITKKINKKKLKK